MNPNQATEQRIDPSDWGALIPDVSGPQLVVAGPGTGKTEFLVRRAAHLINEVVDRADRVLLLTFSRRAAADLRQRVGESVPGSVNRIAASTFHSFAHRLLEAHTDSMPALLTGPEQVSLVRELLSDEERSDWPPTFRPLLRSATFADDVTDFLLRCSERLIGPDQLSDLASERSDWRRLPAFQRRYLAALEHAGRIDYGTLLERAVELVSRPRIADELADHHRYLLVDEWQDTSPAQAELADRLSILHRRITVAGDPYQSVYSFRGAELQNVASFCDRFRALDGSPARRLVLTTSFRVPPEILTAALRVTSPGELPGGAGSVTPAPHRGAVECYVFDQTSAEAEWIAAELEWLHLTEQMPYREMAVLVRSKRRLLPELSRALERRGIPHDQPDIRLVDHPSVQLFLDLARGASLGSGSGGLTTEQDELLQRLLLGPLFGLGVAQQRALVRHRQLTAESWPAILTRELGDDGAAVADLLSEPSWATQLPAVDGFWTAWNRLPQVERMAADPHREDERAAWAAFAQALDRQAERDPEVSLYKYWEMTAEEDFEATPLLSHRDRPGDRLTLTTLHQAKGLTFEVVFVADASEGTFPDLRRGISLLATHALSGLGASATELTRFRLQEEMRLAYTATTRARRRVVWTATAAGIDEDERRPSRFLLAIAGVLSSAELPRPGTGERPPITSRQVQAQLRRLLADPATPPARRLAAASVLTAPSGAAWDAARFAGIRRPGPDSGVTGPDVVLSPSQAETYAECPRRYAFERRLGIGADTSPWARFGGIVHEVLERAEREAMASGRHHATLEEALTALAQVWSERADFGSPGLDERWRIKAEELLERLYAEWPEDSKAAVALEHPLDAELDGLRWRGRVDRVERTADDELRIVDFKTSTKAAPFDEAKESLQLGFYLLAAQADPTLSRAGAVTHAELWFPRSDAKAWRRGFDPTNLTEVKERLTEIGRRIAAEDWTPTLGKWCERCSVRIVCPLWPEGREGFVP